MQCHRLPYLTHIKLIHCFLNNGESHLISNIWSLPKLINFQVENMTLKGIFFSNQLTTSSSSIKYVSIKDCHCNLRDLSFIFEQTPYLQQLHATVASTAKVEQLQSSAPLLTNFNLSFYGALTTMTNVFQKTFNLHCLTLNTSYLLSIPMPETL